MGLHLTWKVRGPVRERSSRGGRAKSGRAALAVLLLAGATWCGAQDGVAGEPNVAFGPQKSAATGQITGSVVDANGDLLRDVELVLSQDSSGGQKETMTDSTGHFRFVGVPAGNFMLTATAAHRTAASFAGVLKEGQTFEVPAFRLEVAESVNVQVVASQEELALEEVKTEEHQRLGGVLPNFFVSYDWKAPPLTAKQKFDLAFKNAIDPGNLFVNGFIAGIQQANDAMPGYGQGIAGYGKRLGADEADLASGTFIGGAILPVLFHQDPRYFWKGTGSVKSRALYAISTAFRARGDNGKWQPAYASILGDISAGAFANLYYPKAERTGLGLTFENGFINVGYDALGNLVQEFLLRHLTPHPPVYGTMDKD